MVPAAAKLGWDEVRLEKFKAVVSQNITKRLLLDFADPAYIRWSDAVDFVSNDVYLQVQQNVLGRVAESAEVRYPADWWQAVRARWLPRWWLRRFPVREERRRIVARELYPKAAMPHHDPVIACSVEGVPDET